MRYCIAKSSSGLTLLEVTLSLALAGLVLTGVYQIAITSIELSSEIEVIQERDTKQHAFIELLRREFRHLPAETRVQLEVVPLQDASRSILTLEEAPLAFGFGATAGHDVVQIVTEPEPDGTYQVLLRYRWLEQDDPRDLILLKGLTSFEWRCYNPALGEWRSDWPFGGNRPSQLELLVGVDGEPPQRYALWIPRIVPSGIRLQPLEQP